MMKRDGLRVVQTLRDSILRMELRPGTILDEAELAARLDVSRTPIREAIIELIAAGLVVRDGRKAKVAPLDFDEVPKLYDALLVSSRLVHRLAAENRTTTDLVSIERHMHAFEVAAETGNGINRSEANQDFHKAVSKAAHNRYICDFYDRVLVDTIRLARACFSGARETGDTKSSATLQSHLATTVAHHREILSAIVDRDVKRADAIAVEHYELTKDRIIKVLFDGARSMASVDDLSLDTWEMD
jgi:DNA-binding GntR family transcriptional regulator